MRCYGFKAMRILIFLILVFAAPAFAEDKAEEAKNGSGLPLPRFATLRSEEANLRSGPGTRYPIQWVYHRKGMPIEITEEYDNWRRVRDMEGTTGWLHKTMLSGVRNVLIHSKQPQLLRAEPEEKAKPMLKLAPNVIAQILQCDKTWCRVRVADEKGWMKKPGLWGVYNEEVLK